MAPKKEKDRRGPVYVGRPLPPSQQRYKPDVLQDPVENFVITALDLKNHFAVTVTYPEMTNASDSLKSFPVIGGQTVGHLGSRISTKLWEADKVLSPQCTVDLYENGGLCSSLTLLVDLLKTSKREGRGDGVTLTFECIAQGLWGEKVDYFTA